jgi:hypothetical protein
MMGQPIVDIICLALDLSLALRIIRWFDADTISPAREATTAVARQ